MMRGTRTLGFVLMAGGFLGAAFATVCRAELAGRPWEAIAWTGYGVSLAVGVVGVVLLRLTARQEASCSHKVEADLQTMESSLTRLVATLADLNRTRDSVSVYDVHSAIDEQMAEDLGAFADAREALIPRYGLQPYADLMSRFATAERLINRTWSASVDGYIDEVWSCMGRAETILSEAHALFTQYKENRLSP